MVRVLVDGKPMLIALTRASAEEYIARHSPAMQKRMTIKVTREREAPCDTTK